MSDYVVLVEQAAQDDLRQRHDAFEALIVLFQPMAYGQAYRLLQDRHMAEDAVQEAFLNAWLHLPQLSEPAAFPGWLRRIVMTQCDRLTRRKTPPLSVWDDESLMLAEASIEDAYEQQDLQQRVLAAVRALPAHERAVTEGFYLQGESTQELAERLEIPLPTVRKRLQYAREHLRALVGGLNAAVDQALADLLPPAAPPMQKQPIYLYNPRDE